MDDPPRQINWRQPMLTARIPGEGMPLSQGLRQFDYVVEVFVRAKDVLGGSTVSEPMEVTVSHQARIICQLYN